MNTQRERTLKEDLDHIEKYVNKICKEAKITTKEINLERYNKAQEYLRIFHNKYNNLPQTMSYSEITKIHGESPMNMAVRIQILNIQLEQFKNWILKQQNE